MNRTVLLALALLWPTEALTSGSSTVRATGAHLAVHAESVRKIFNRGAGESEWHAEWKAENQSLVDAARAVLEPVLDEVAAAESLKLAPWSDALPEARAGAPAGHETSVAVVCTAGCRVRLQPWQAGTGLAVPGFEVEVALAEVPPEGALDRVNVAFAKALAAPEPPPPSTLPLP